MLSAHFWKRCAFFIWYADTRANICISNRMWREIIYLKQNTWISIYIIYICRCCIICIYVYMYQIYIYYILYTYMYTLTYMKTTGEEFNKSHIFVILEKSDFKVRNVHVFLVIRIIKMLIFRNMSSKFPSLALNN